MPVRFTTVLRPATMDDSEIILKWQRHPKTRQFFHNPLQPSDQEHLSWMTKRLADSRGLMMMVLCNNESAGLVRLDLIGPGIYEVSILVDPERHGRGIGKAALAELRNLKQGAEFRAQVLSDNLASKALFESAVYRPESGYFVSRPPIRAVFRADASADIGAGHVTRSLALADKLAEAGWSCAFACKEDTLATVPALEDAGHRIIVLEGTEADEAEILEIELGADVAWLIVDHYRRDATFESTCRTWARQIMVIDDLADRRHDCDLLLDQGPARKAPDYAPLIGKGCQFLLGSDYAMLRPQFANAREDTLPPGRIGDVQHILVCMGSVDAGNITAVVLKALANLDIDIEIDVVLGPDAPHLGAVSNLAKTLPREATVHIGVENMASLMRAADLAIGAAGTSSWERCCLGLPSIAILVANNQSSNAECLKISGAAHVLDGRSSVSGEQMELAIRELVGDGPRRQAMAINAYRMCDGLGTERVVQAMTEMTSSIN